VQKCLYPQLPSWDWLESKSESAIILQRFGGGVRQMIEAFVEFALSFCFVWLAFVASYSLYSLYNSPRRIIRRKLIETGL
jgi:hypothetical protein